MSLGALIICLLIGIFGISTSTEFYQKGDTMTAIVGFIITGLAWLGVIGCISDMVKGSED